jgi:6,7-dimethyl-8-ribityllumazine synthase
MIVHEGRRSGRGRRFAVVASRFNLPVVRRLLNGCLRALREGGVREADLEVAWVPGSFEVPVAARACALSGRFAAVIGLGAVIRGETDHYDHVCREAAAGVAAVSRETGVPCLFGILTTDTVAQAMRRSGSRSGNRGADVARAALEMADLLPRLRGRRRGA